MTDAELFASRLLHAPLHFDRLTKTTAVESFSPWDAAAWPTMKQALKDALPMQAQMRRAWWN